MSHPDPTFDPTEVNLPEDTKYEEETDTSDYARELADQANDRWEHYHDTAYEASYR